MCIRDRTINKTRHRNRTTKPDNGFHSSHVGIVFKIAPYGIICKFKGTEEGGINVLEAGRGERGYHTLVEKQYNAVISCVYNTQYNYLNNKYISRCV